MVLPKADTSSWKLIFLAAWCWQGQIFRYPAWTFSRNTCFFMFDGACGRRRLISNAFLKLPGGRVFCTSEQGKKEKIAQRTQLGLYIPTGLGERLRIRWKKWRREKKKALLGENVGLQLRHGLVRKRKYAWRWNAGYKLVDIHRSLLWKWYKWLFIYFNAKCYWA